MHSRLVSITAIAVVSFLSIFWQTTANATAWFDGQEILVECPVWEWEASPIPGVEYELCFNDVDSCTVVEIGDSVCIPSQGVHDVWITAIDYQNGDPIYYDGDIVSVSRVGNADFTGDGLVGFSDFSLFIDFFGATGGPGDLDGDGIVGFGDFAQFARAFSKCVNEAGTVYEPC